jgi:hypothetical protein
MHHSASLGIHTPYGSVERSFRNQSEASEEAALFRQVISPVAGGLEQSQHACMPLLWMLAPAPAGGCTERRFVVGSSLLSLGLLWPRCHLACSPFLSRSQRGFGEGQ